ncbi:hypothetical protein K8I61_02940 [bacterium]|nr:hypothetical protein [bacterium]
MMLEPEATRAGLRTPPPGLSSGKALIAIGAAIVFAIGAWAWWVSHDRINTINRPHFIVWDLVVDMQARRGIATSQGLNDVASRPLHRAVLTLTSRLGDSLPAMTAMQIPFMIALIAASASIAWRLAGTRAAALAAAFATTGPMTVGLATSPDDLLATQACIAAAVALWLWSWHRRWWPVGFASAIPLAFGVSAPETISAQLNFVMIAGFAAAGAIVWAYVECRRERGGAPPFAPAVAVIGSLAFAFMKTGPFPLDYLRAQAARPRFESLSVARTPEAIFAFPVEWFVHMAGPALAVVTIVSVVLAIRRGRGMAVVPLVVWLAAPMIVFTVISKRHAFYPIDAAPAAYPLAALGFAWIGDARRRRIVSIGAVAVTLAGFLAVAASDIRRIPHPYFERVFEQPPHPYLFSPRSPKRMPFEDLGRAAAGICAPRNLPVHIVAPPGMSPFVGVEVWQAARDLPFVSIESGPFFDDAHCLIVLYPAGGESPRDLNGALRRYADWPSAPMEPGAARRVASRLDRIHEIAGEYRIEDQNIGWTIFAHDNPRDGT